MKQLIEFQPLVDPTQIKKQLEGSENAAMLLDLDEILEAYLEEMTA